MSRLWVLEMFKTLKEFFETALSKKTGVDDEARSLELSAAVLMIEIALADSRIENDELRVINDILQQHFNMSADESANLLELGRREVDHAISLFNYTRTLNEQLSAEEKVKLIEMLWRVAVADVVIDKYEEYYIRKVADLLYVPHAEYIKAKLNAIS